MRLQFGVLNNPELRGIMQVNDSLFPALLAGYIITLQTREGKQYRLRPVSFTTTFTDKGLQDNFYEEEIGQEQMTFEEVAEDAVALPAATHVETQGSGSPFTHHLQE